MYMFKAKNTDWRRQSGFYTVGIQYDIEENESEYDLYAEYTLNVYTVLLEARRGRNPISCSMPKKGPNLSLPYS